MTAPWIAAALALLGLLGCTENPSAEGPSTETSGIAARLLDSVGTPLAGVKVRVVATGEAWRDLVSRNRSSVLAVESTNALGVVRFQMPDRRPVVLEVGTRAISARLETVPGSDSVRELRASRSLRLGVVAKVPRETILDLFLAGSGSRADRLSDSAWVFATVPAGVHTVVALTDSGMALLGRVVLAGHDLDTALSADVDSVLLEDFAVPLRQNRYGALLGGGWWFLTSDASEGGLSRVVPGDFQDALVPCALGSCIGLDFFLDPTRTNRWALVGMDIDGGNHAVGAPLANLSQVPSVRFEAAGTGSFWFQLGVRTDRGTLTACHVPFEAPPTLSTVEIMLSSLTCDSVGADLRTTYSLTWASLGDNHLDLGHVRLVGAGPRSVFPRLGRP